MGTGVDGFVAGAKRVSDVPFALRQDFAGGNAPIYIGESAPGTTTASALWRIQKRTYSNYKLTTIEWADGNSNFDNVYNNRTTLSYS